MKLAFVCTEMNPVPCVRGGAIQTMIDGVTPFLRDKHDLTIFSVADPHLPKRERRDGVEYIRFPRERYWVEVRQALRRLSADVAHVYNRPQFLPMLKAAVPRTRFVLSLHNEMFHQSKLPARIALKALRAAHRIITVSDYIANTVTARFPAAARKIRTVYSGADLAVFQPVWEPEATAAREQLREELGVSDKRVILFAGRLSPKKGPDVLIRAMDQVLKKHPDAALVIVGGRTFSDNSVTQYIRRLHKLAKPHGDRVQFTKYVSAKDIHRYFWIGDVFVCSSQWQEPLARVHYEAMAAGLPVITTRRGGNPEVVTHGENGLIVKAYKDPDAFAEAINAVFSDPELARRLAQNGRAFVENNHSFSHVADRLEEVYLEAHKSLVRRR